MTIESTMKASVDVVSVSTLGAYLLGLAPAVATIFTAIWAILRVIEQLRSMGWLGEKTPPPPSPYEPLD